MVIVVLVAAALVAGVTVGLVVRARPDADPAVTRRIAGVGAFAGFAIFAILGVVVRTHPGPIGPDLPVATWAARHATDASSTILRGLTRVGSTVVMVVILVAVGLLEHRRRPSRRIWIFLALVAAGEVLVANLVKVAVDRPRPAIDPLASFAGASFPSGHSTTAAACFAALALVLARGRSRRVRALLAGGAVGLAVAIGCSRMLLGVHWFSDVVAGLALGWAWFATIALATGAFETLAPTREEPPGLRPGGSQGEPTTGRQSTPSSPVP